jgi:hypothetical protein
MLRILHLLRGCRSGLAAENGEVRYCVTRLHRLGAGGSFSFSSPSAAASLSPAESSQSFLHSAPLMDPQTVTADDASEMEWGPLFLASQPSPGCGSKAGETATSDEEAEEEDDNVGEVD